MAVRPLLVPLLLLASILAGCISGDDVDSGEAPEEELPVESEAGLGTVKGTVLTISLDPVTNGRVNLVTGGQLVTQTSTNSQGKYSFTNVDPGEYVIQFSSLCCKEEVRGVRVEADKEVDVNVQLTPHSADDLQVARMEQMEWTGFLACTLRWPTGGVLPYSGLSACSVYDPTGMDDFLHEWEVKKGVKSIVGALVWDAPGAALGDELTLYVERAGAPNAHPRYARPEGPSPLEWRVDEGYIIETYDDPAAHEHDFSNIENSKQLMFRVFAGGELNVVYQQKFTMYWDIYYWEQAPEHASAAPDI